ncbi:MAG: hypothetical protein MH472_12670 [Bacteroidia bacterium]|nr:hypothetical protein [Bacteroidia bacterium]
MKLEAVDKKIWDLIKHYLHKHTELCLEEFGRFAAQSNEFSVDPIAKKIIPAQKKIYFQVGNFENTPEFIQFVSEVLNISSEEIVNILHSFWKKFKLELQTLKRVEIEGLGLFKFNVMGEIDFESVQTDPFLDETFGLKPIHFAANLLKTKRIVVETVEEEDAALVEMRETALKELKVLLDQARISESQHNPKSNKLFPIVASVLTLILLINLALFLYKGPVDGIKQQISQMNIFENPAAILDTQQKSVPEPKPELAPQEHTAVQSESPVAAEPQVQAVPSAKEENTPLPVEVPAEKEISNAEPITVETSSSAALIGRFMTKGNYELDSTWYLPAVAEPSIINAEPAASVSVQPEITTTVNTTTEPKIEAEEKAVSTTEESKEIDYDMPYMVNVDAQINDVERGFYVIAGAFKIEANAQRFKEKLIKAGDTSALVIKPSRYPYYLVSYQKNNNLNKALNLYEKREKAHPSIWVYCAY